MVANTARNSAAAAHAAAAKAAAAGQRGAPVGGAARDRQEGHHDHALAVGFSRGFEVSAGIVLLALIITLVMIRVSREDLGLRDGADDGLTPALDTGSGPAGSLPPGRAASSFPASDRHAHVRYRVCLMYTTGVGARSTGCLTRLVDKLLCQAI